MSLTLPRSLDVHPALTSPDLAILRPPPGVRPNFEDPDQNTGPFFVVTSILLILVVLCIVNRAYVKTYIIRKYTWDDLTGALGVVFALILYVACVWGALKGKTWVHKWDLTGADVASKNFVIPIWLFSTWNAIATGTLRITFFIAYLNIFSLLRWLRISAYAGIIFTALSHVAVAIAIYILTTPENGQSWFSAETSDRHQRFIHSLVVAPCAIGFAVDLYILVLPLIAVSGLQMSRWRKVGVYSVFLTGILACMASVLTIYYRYLLVNTADTSWALAPVSTVTITELFIGIIVLCIPSAARSYRYHYDRLRKLREIDLSPAHRLEQTSNPYSHGSNRSGSYAALREIEDGSESHMAHPTRPGAVIHTGKQYSITEDGVRVEYELQPPLQEKENYGAHL